MTRRHSLDEVRELLTHGLECVSEVEGLPLGPRALRRPHDLLNAPRRSLVDVQPAPKGVSSTQASRTR
jgi:hypothetical protein